MNPSFHVIKVNPGEVTHALRAQLESEGNETMQDGDSIFVVLLIRVGPNQQAQMILYPGYNVWVGHPGSDMYDELEAMVGKQVAWEDAPDSLRNEFCDSQGNLDFVEEDDPTGIAIPL